MGTLTAGRTANQLSCYVVLSLLETLAISHLFSWDRGGDVQMSISTHTNMYETDRGFMEGRYVRGVSPLFPCLVITGNEKGERDNPKREVTGRGK